MLMANGPEENQHASVRFSASNTSLLSWNELYDLALALAFIL